MYTQMNIFGEIEPEKSKKRPAPGIKIYTTKYDQDRKINLVAEKSVKYYDESGSDIIDRGEKAAGLIEKAFHASSLPEEHLWLIALDGANKCSGIFEVSHGTLTASLVHPREVFTRAILCGAASIIIAHNHPSASTTISEKDWEVTNRIREAGEIMGIALIDHIIIAGSKIISAM